MGTILPLRNVMSDEPNIGFMDECGTLQSMIGAFALQVIGGNFSKLVVDQRKQIIQSLLISSSPTDQELCNLPVGGVASHRVAVSAPGAGAVGPGISGSSGAVNHRKGCKTRVQQPF